MKSLKYRAACIPLLFALSSCSSEQESTTGDPADASAGASATAGSLPSAGSGNSSQETQAGNAGSSGGGMAASGDAGGGGTSGSGNQGQGGMDTSSAGSTADSSGAAGSGSDDTGAGGGHAGSAGSASAGSAGDDAGGSAAGGSSGSAGAGGVTANDEGCRSSASCSSEERCLLPGQSYPPCRGVFCGDEGVLCDSDDSCGSTLCRSGTNACGEIFSACLPPCESDLDCCDGVDCPLTCSDTGKCISETHCSVTGSCPEQFVCDPTTGTPDGCRRIDCAEDEDCVDGYCINSVCYVALGSCTPLPDPCMAP